MGAAHNPVWEVYDNLRTVRLNVKYYSCKLKMLQRWNTSMEIMLAVMAPSSAIAGLGFQKYELGALLWKVCGAVAALLAVLKPIVGLTKRVKDTEGIVSGYRILDFDLLELKAAIEHKRHYDATLQAQFKKAMQRLRTLVTQTATQGPSDKRLLRECQEEVRRELPVKNFFIPP